MNLITYHLHKSMGCTLGGLYFLSLSLLPKSHGRSAAACTQALVELSRILCGCFQQSRAPNLGFLIRRSIVHFYVGTAHFWKPRMLTRVDWGGCIGIARRLRAMRTSSMRVRAVPNNCAIKLSPKGQANIIARTPCPKKCIIQKNLHMSPPLKPVSYPPLHSSRRLIPTMLLLWLDRRASMPFYKIDFFFCIIYKPEGHECPSRVRPKRGAAVHNIDCSSHGE